jgi:hypothetical protein
VLSLQLQIDAEAAVAARTQQYLRKLEEFRAVSAARAQQPPSGSQQQQQLHHAHSPLRLQRHAGGAQGEESKCSEDNSPPLSGTSASSAAQAGLVEQQLLHSRDALLQCTEANDAFHDPARAIALRAQPFPIHAPFTPSHAYMLRLLVSTSASLSSSSLPAVLPSSLLDRIDVFLHERSSLLEEKRTVSSAWRVVQTFVGLQAQRKLVPATQADGIATSTAGGSELAGLSVHVLINLFHCRFQRQQLLLELRLEDFQRLRDELREVLLLFFDALLLTDPATDSAACPSDALAGLTAPPAGASAAELACWSEALMHTRAIAHATALPAAYRNVDVRTYTSMVTRRRSALFSMPRDQLVQCAQLVQLLFFDVAQTIALTTELDSPVEASATMHALLMQQQKRHHASAAQPAAAASSAAAGSHAAASSKPMVAAAYDGFVCSLPESKDDPVSLSPPVPASSGTPAPAQVTPRSHPRSYQPQQQPQTPQAHSAGSGSGGKFRPQHRHHPYHAR